MKKLTIGLSLAALTLAGAAQAQTVAERRGADANADRVVTRAEMQAHAATAFARADHNKDGKIDAADRQARRAARLETRFDRLDADDNGQISRDEFGRERPLLRRGDRPQGANEARAPRRARVIGGKAMRGGQGRMADANKDQVVTRAEFTAAAVQRFERMDANRDGSVTAEERRAQRGAIRGRRAAPGA